jgi:hypothetical protein
VESFLVTLGELAFPVDGAPLALRIVLAVLALLLLLLGGRLGRHGPRVAVVMAGALCAVAGIAASHAPERYMQPWAFAGLVTIGTAVALWLEQLGYRAALFVAGVVVGAMYGVALREAFDAVGSPWFVGLGALVVGIGLPWVFETVPRLCAPLVGSAGVAWALGYPASLPLLIGAWGLGVTVQMFTGPAALDLEGEEQAEAGG